MVAWLQHSARCYRQSSYNRHSQHSGSGFNHNRQFLGWQKPMVYYMKKYSVIVYTCARWWSKPLHRTACLPNIIVWHRQNDPHFAILYLHGDICISFILHFVPKYPFERESALVQITVRRWTVDNLLPETMPTNTHDAKWGQLVSVTLIWIDSYTHTIAHECLRIYLIPATHTP